MSENVGSGVPNSEANPAAQETQMLTGAAALVGMLAGLAIGYLIGLSVAGGELAEDATR